MEKIRAELRKNLFIIVSPEQFSKIMSGSIEKLGADNLHHVRNVLRKSGEINVNISCGDGRILSGIVDSENNIRKSSSEPEYRARSIKTSLITPGIMRKNLEFIIKKSVELGVDSIYFIASDYQNYPVEKPARYEKIIANACEQSKNPFFLKLQSMNKKIYDYPFDSDTYYIWGDPEGSILIKDIPEKEYSNRKEICYINGPEGGWSTQEEDFLKNRFRGIRLSDNVLRAETAAIVALSSIKFLL